MTLTSPHLFNHLYDIDDVIRALCAPTPQFLTTTTGTLSAQPDLSAPASHRFEIAPLPATFLNEISDNSEVRHLTAAEQTELTTLLQTTTIQQLPSHFQHGRLGGWLRERLKEAALEWLDTHNLIPPSMRHINRRKATALARKISITSDE